MSTKSLNVVPVDPFYALPPDELLIPALVEMGFLGEECTTYGFRFFRTGRRFLDLIRFERSHTVVELVPDDQGGLIEGNRHDSRGRCQINIDRSPDGLPRVIASCLTRAPRCRTCGAERVDWGEMLSGWWKDRMNKEYQSSCPACKAAAAPWRMDWGHRTAIACDFIEIEGIQPGEAVPGETMMSELKSIVGVDFDYVYTWL